MATGAGNFRDFILGLLAHKPMSGYDIRRFLKSLGWLVGSPSFGSIYPALHSLLQDDLVTVTVTSYESKPPRKIYSVTQEGMRVFQAWIDQPMVEDASLKAFIMHLILSQSLPKPRLIAHLRQRREQVTTYRAGLKQMVAEAEVDVGQRLALDYGMAVASAELAWLDARLEELSQEPLPELAPEGDLVGGIA